MSLTCIQMQTLCQEINLKANRAVCSSIDAWGPRTFVIGLESGKQKYSLLLCLQTPFMRFHFTDRLLEVQKNSFAYQLSKLLKGKQLIHAALLNEDRILSLSWEGNQIQLELVAEFFSRHPNLYLLDDQHKILLSLFPSEQTIYQLPERPQFQNRENNVFSESLTSAQVAQRYAFLEKETSFQKLKQNRIAFVKKLLKSAQRCLAERKQILIQCKQWEVVYHEGMLLQANLFRIRKGMKEIEIEDWEQAGRPHCIVLDPLMEPSEQVAQRFRQSKKQRLGITHAEDQIQKVEVEVTLRLQQLAALEAIASLDELEHYLLLNTPLFKEQKQKRSSSEKKENHKPYHCFSSQSGMEIWVGKSAKDNDRLTFHCSKGSDWWLHARDYSGSHVVMRVSKNQEPDSESLKDAAELALRFSKAKAKGEGEISLTQVKWLRRLPSVSGGRVMLSKHKVLYCNSSEERWQRLKHSKKNTG